jgi:sec-independent protein translocase protein TatB
MSITQLIVILVIALIVLGPDKLPLVARTVGKALAEFRRITGDFRSTIEGEMREIERETALKEIRQSFPENIHYDLQTEEATIASGEPAAPAPSVPATEAETPTAPGKPSNGEPTPV